MEVYMEERKAPSIIKILVVDDHALVRHAIIRILNSEKWIDLVGEASNGFEALAKVRELKPDLILMDLYMPGMDGITAIRLIHQESPNIKVVFLSVSDDERDIVEAIQAGARGYICKKTDDVSELFLQIKRALAGEVAMSEKIAAKFAEGLSKKIEKKAPTSLTPREKDVLAFIARGTTSKGIASYLSISESTVRAHIRNLMRKLGADNRTQLAVYGVLQGFGRRNKWLLRG